MTDPAPLRAAADLIERRQLHICAIYPGGEILLYETDAATVGDIVQVSVTADWYPSGDGESRQLAGLLDGVPVRWIEHRPIPSAPQLASDAVTARSASASSPTVTVRRSTRPSPC